MRDMCVQHLRFLEVAQVGLCQNGSAESAVIAAVHLAPGLGCFTSMTVCLIVLVLYTTGVQSDSDSSAVNNKMSGQCNVKPNRPSLAKILLSLDGNLAKQQALSHVLSALQIMYARYVVYTSSPGGSEDSCTTCNCDTTRSGIASCLFVPYFLCATPSNLK